MNIGDIAKGFVRALEKRHIHYTHRKLRGVYDQVVVVFTGNQIPEITINFIFDDDNSTVMIRVIDIIPVIKANKRELYLEVVNDLNNEFTFGKFCITKDSELEFRIDALVDSECAGDFCYQLMYKAIKICDDSYLRLAQV